jgi:hypothetical protein
MEGCNRYRAIRQPAVKLTGFEGALTHHLHGFLVEGTPIPDGTGEIFFGSEGRHIGFRANSPCALCSSLYDRRGGVLVLGDHVGTRFHQGDCSLFLRRRIEPGERPYDAHLGLGIDRAHTEGKSVDAGDHGRDRPSGHKANHIRPGHGAGHQAGQIPPIPEFAVVVENIVSRRHRRGNAKEILLWVFLRHFPSKRLIAKSGGENQIKTLCQQVSLHLGDNRRFRY